MLHFAVRGSSPGIKYTSLKIQVKMRVDILKNCVVSQIRKSIKNFISNTI